MVLKCYYDNNIMVQDTILSQNISNYKQIAESSGMGLGYQLLQRKRQEDDNFRVCLQTHRNQDKPKQLSETLSQKNIRL